MYVSVLLLFIVIILLIIFKNKQRWKQNNSPPGPFSWPFIGNQSLLKRLVRKHGSQHVAFWKLAQRYKSDVIMLRLGMRNIIVVSGMTTVHKLLCSDDFDGRPWNEFIKLRNMGIRKGITMNDGTEWKDVRLWVVRALKTVGYGKREMSKLIQDELVVIIENLKKGGINIMKEIIAPAVINVLWTFTTGKRINDVSKLRYFNDLMERRARAFDMVGGILSTFPWIRYIAPEISGYNLLVKINDELKNFLTEIIYDHKKNYVSGNESNLIDMFFREMYDQKGSKNIFTEEQLLMILLDLFIAGFNTTTTTLDFLFLHMVVHQDIQKKVREEITTKIKLDEFPKLEDRIKLPYVEAFITEVQRMYTITPIIGPRRAFKDTILEGYSIPKNTVILINLYSINMDPDFYANPHEFKPERFFKDNAYQPDKNLVLFGKGNRRCPGEHLAKSALFLLFVGIMQKYALLPVQGQKPYVVEAIPGLTIAPKPYETIVVP
ncbi:probable cytochrome P450 305a1 [Vespa mandarinia]|uniref:probable cytochrome P450 305a1 n=1 Tax=Vespa mandarinia TaxID=7446 RepID=UPI0016137F56|nr:probable cytochrome P450 305a1 [Vespa mandarinia]